jgi:hypothetical protein
MAISLGSKLIMNIGLKPAKLYVQPKNRASMSFNGNHAAEFK